MSENELKDSIQDAPEAQDSKSYDELVYDQLPHKQGNLRLLETIADLYGIKPVDIHHCRVLEIGTATGKTIIPQAEEFPESRFLGIDLSQVQINVGKELLRSLNLRNIELRAANIMDIDESWGEFDYIIAHGIYSWVPPFVQEKMLDVLRTNLSPHGVAMYSYNTYPGWLFGRFARDFLVFHTKEANTFDVQTAVAEARAGFDFVTDFVAPRKDFFANSVEKCQERLKKASDHYLYHEYLEAFNDPCYYYEFCKRLQEKDLHCIADFNWAKYYTMKKGGQLKPLIKDAEHDDVVLEQYCDYLLNQTFRSSVICRRDIKPEINEQDILNRYHFYIPAGCNITKIDAKEDAPAVWQFELPGGAKAVANQGQLIDLVCDYFITHRDGFFTMNDLWKAIAPKFPNQQNLQSYVDSLGQAFSRMVKDNIVQIVLHPPADRVVDKERPYARMFVRQMLKRDAKTVPNAMFESVGVDVMASRLMRKFDGRRAISEHVTDFQQEMRKGKVNIVHDGEPILADQRDKITLFVENVVQTLRNRRLVF